MKDLLSVIDFFHENGVALQIDNLGITSLVEGKVNPSIMIIVQMMGALISWGGVLWGMILLNIKVVI